VIANRSLRRADAGSQRGSGVLYAVVLSPILLLSLALAVQLGALQMERQRVRSAVDEAAVVAATRATAMTQSRVSLDPATAKTLMRTALADNLRSFEGEFAGVTADQVARDARIEYVVDVPHADPLLPGHTVSRPTLEAEVRIPMSSGLLGLAGVPPTVTLTIITSADLRLSGAASAP
jgi:Flp pilus assembly protein TadG